MKTTKILGFVSTLVFLSLSYAYATSCTQYGNMSMCDDGTSYTQYGNMIMGSNGTSYTTYGNTTMGSDGSSYTRYGNTTMTNDGRSYTQYGNTIMGSDGSSYTQYGNTTMGSGNSYSSCPANSSYNSLSSGCKCNYGYVIDNNGNCSSGYTVCSQKYGYNSSYNSSSNKCSCNYGYQFDTSGQCVSNDTYCTNIYGYGSEYSSLKDICVCRTGYTTNSAKNGCILNSTYTPSTYTTPTPTYTAPVPSSASCPLNSHISGSTCYCDDGYQINSTKDACNPSTSTLDKQCKSTFGTDSSWDTQKYTCVNKTTTATTVSTVTAKMDDASCKTTYGNGSYSGGNLCYCSLGYQWGTMLNQCIKSKMTITSSLRYGSTGIETVILKNFLANQKLYSGYVNTPFDNQTTDAVTKFQSNNGLPATGIVGALTRAKINKMLLQN